MYLYITHIHTQHEAVCNYLFVFQHGQVELSHGMNYSDEEEEVQDVESALTDLSFVSKQPRFGRLAFESHSSPLPYAHTKKVIFGGKKHVVPEIW